jgi:hypothetical protein
MTKDEFAEMQKGFADLAQKFVDKGYPVQFVSEAMGSTILDLGPHDDELKRRVILEGTYAAIARVLGRDASAMLP